MGALSLRETKELGCESEVVEKGLKINFPGSENSKKKLEHQDYYFKNYLHLGKKMERNVKNKMNCVKRL